MTLRDGWGRHEWAVVSFGTQYHREVQNESGGGEGLVFFKGLATERLTMLK